MNGNRSETETRLKVAALRVWSRYGFHGAPVKMIADESGINVSLINRYFDGKEGLLLALIEDMIKEKQTGDLDYPPQKTLEKEVLLYLRFRYREDIRRQDAIRIIISELAINSSFREKALASLTYAADENFRDRLERLKETGKITHSANVQDIFRQISLFSFSCSFIEGLILKLSECDTDRMITSFAKMLSQEFAFKDV